MAKKVRRVKKKRKTTPVAKSTLEKEAEEVVEKLSSTEQFRQDYAYVVKDLRRVLLLSGAMFILLVALNLLVQL